MSGFHRTITTTAAAMRDPITLKSAATTLVTFLPLLAIAWTVGVAWADSRYGTKYERYQDRIDEYQLELDLGEPDAQRKKLLKAYISQLEGKQKLIKEGE